MKNVTRFTIPVLVILTMLLSALSGLADYSDTDGTARTLVRRPVPALRRPGAVTAAQDLQSDIAWDFNPAQLAHHAVMAPSATTTPVRIAPRDTPPRASGIRSSLTSSWV